MRHLTLGLDLGPNSIGWALVEEDGTGPRSLEAIGVRVFQEMVDRQKKTPKSHKRRDARQARRQRSRRKMRRDTLARELGKCGLLPESAAEREELFHRTDPYEIRMRGLDHELPPHELGRAIFHLNQRRGFLSNRKVRDSGEKKKEDGVVKQAIGELEREIEESKSRTLGEFLADQPKKRNRRTDRKMYEDEFDALWKMQAEFHPEFLTDALRARIRKILFFQRPLKLQKNLVGKCAFEPHKKRSPWCRPEAQWFRALQDVNHLEVKDPETGGYRPLEQSEREAIKNQLREKKTLSWNGVRKALGFHSNETFNVEDGGKNNLMGARTLVDVRKILTKKTWEAMFRSEQDEFLEDLFSIHKEEALLKRLEEHWKLSHEQAEAFLNTEFQPGYASLSLRAIRRITPHLENGLNYHDACRAAGYRHDYEKEIDAKDALPPAPDLRNPIVQKAINEVRRVVNAVVREYGKPSRIRVELARDLKLSKRRKDELNRQNRKNRDLNDEARTAMAEVGVSDNGENRLRYRLWKEQKSMCPYTGASIGARDIFSPEYEVDHVLPYSRTLDDSYLNKVLSLASANREKGDRTPHEWKGGDQKEFTDMRQRVSSMKEMPFNKRRRFDQKEIKLDSFIERQLNDTRYISREVKDYLKDLGADMQITTGQATAALRRSWGMNAILAVDSDMEKNRADHRHHAIDALVVALTSRKLFYSIANLSEKQREILGKRRFPLPDPWPGFMGEVREKVDSIVVSHQPLRKISGAFHEETAYGRISHEGRDVFVRRVPLESLTAKQVEKIVDRRIRELVGERLETHGGNARAAFAKPLNLEHSRKGAGRTQIKTVRVAENLSADGLFGVERKGEDAPFKYYALGNNHHIEIVESVETGRRKGIVVSAMEAARRARRARTPIVQRDHGEEWRFVMSLSINDLVKFDAPENGCNLYRVQQINNIVATGAIQIMLRAHTSATIDDNATRIITSPNTLRGRKVSVDLLGKLESAHD
ncbi:MAG: type II CRISPR RNA-guided endonuclease Cas9 [Nitrospinae bacterium]|nr:type II CRISPR RNA-guided endonuclease Cas9 [Nitrospinota bacterium]